MNNNDNLSLESANSSQISDDSKALAASIVIAFERTGTEPFNIQPMIRDIEREFHYLTTEDKMKAIRNGGVGKYGRTYKLTTQEVCVWIREYIKEKNDKKFNPFR